VQTRSPGLVGGLDGCRAGWVLATVAARPMRQGWGADSAAEISAAEVSVAVLPDLAPVVAALASGQMVAAGIDIPIGLAVRGPRACDREARRLLGPRRSSVFPAPARAVLGASSYEEACAISRRIGGRAISKQLYNILPKIREVDRLQSQPRSRLPHLLHLFEMCPELSFSLMTGAPLRHTKKAPAGRAERIAALRPAFGDVTPFVEPPPAGAARDDVLDALAGAWTARRYAAGSCLRLGGEVDETGLRMEVIA
jgi:predicted RNase H-like nuclease